MTYRARPCAFCDERGQSSCGRCGDWVCTAHAPGGLPHCALCEKELRDDLDEMRFVEDMKNPGEDRGIFARQGKRGPPLLSGISKWLGERRVKKRFARRTAEEIAAWRRRAGVAVRAS